MLFAGCATDLLVGADTEGATGSTAGDAADDGPDAGPDDGGPTGADDDGGDAPTGTTGEPPTSDDTAGTTFSLDTGDSGTTSEGGGEEATGDGGDCDAADPGTCNGMAGCMWVEEKRACVPVGDECAGLLLDACVLEEGCLWFGSIGDGGCESGSCETQDGERQCLAASEVCGWNEANCTALPCGELDSEVCDPNPTCAVVGPEAEPVCVPDDCIAGECFKTAPKACLDSPTCHLLGEGKDSTCLPVECVGCAELSAEECESAEECTFDPKEMVCNA